MIVASFNVNSIRVRLPIILPWLQKAGIDCCAFQETKVQDGDFPVDAFAEAGYHVFFKGEKSYNGVAMAATFEPDEVSYGFDGSGSDEGSRLIRLDWKGMTIVNTYVPQGTDPDSERFQYKLDWFSRLHDYFKAVSSESLLWCGDFNVAPEAKDVHSPEKLLGNIGFHPLEHEALAGVKQFGFIDIFRKHCPDEGEYTFWDYRVRDGLARGLGWRIDHIWATPKLASASVRSWIDTSPRMLEKPSDHTPILAEFDV